MPLAMDRVRLACTTMSAHRRRARLERAAAALGRGAYVRLDNPMAPPRA
jgi:hypothetical protein